MNVFDWWSEVVRLHAARNAFLPCERLGPVTDPVEAQALLADPASTVSMDSASTEQLQQIERRLVELQGQLHAVGAAVRTIPMLGRLAAQLDLSDRDLLVLSAAMFPDVQWRFHRLLTVAQGAQERPLFTLELLSRVLGLHSFALEQELKESRLLRLRLVVLVPDPSHTPTPAGSMLRAFPALLRLWDVPEVALPENFIEVSASHPEPWVEDAGILVIEASPSADARKEVVRRVGLREVVDVPSPGPEAQLRTVFDLALETTLTGGLLFFDHWDAWCRAVPKSLLLSAFAEFPLPIALRTESLEFVPRAFAGRPIQRHVVNLPSSSDRLRIWEEALSQESTIPRAVLENLAGEHPLHAAEIRNVVLLAEQNARAECRGSEGADFHQVAQELRRGENSGLARTVQPARCWSDLILPLATKERLQEICNRVRHRRKVFEDWGFEQRLSNGRGVTAMFSGPPGTGKTLAAEVLAGELGTHLVHVDLARVVNKYIGETEKMLSRLFASVERGVGVLFFDEADALFGKRTEVKDSHDRYANLEVSYLLQLLEEFDGLAILTTNLKRNIDDAFLRRLQFNISFPQPGEAERFALWHHFLHEDLPQSEDIDIDFLAQRFALTGASIRNATLRAAFHAAHAETHVGMAELLQAIQAEYRQLEQAFDPRLIREYEPLLRSNGSIQEVER